jgi:hypothetical protein
MRPQKKLTDYAIQKGMRVDHLEGIDKDKIYPQ